MMKRTAVINVVGLSPGLLPHTPSIARFAGASRLHRVLPAFPAVTCSAQSTYLTGCPPAQHGIVGNGWYDRSLAEVQFWKQSNHLVQAPKLWDELRARDSSFTCANLFWWYNMYSTADISITPRPIYRADGKKIFDIHSWPYQIRPAIKKDLGEFPFATFWGPAAGTASPQGAPDAASRWIAQSAKWIERKYRPTLSLVYLPHLDYNLQRFGPSQAAEDSQRIDSIAGDLLDFYREREVQPLIVSEYGISPVDQAVHLNRLFRREGWVVVKEELENETLDCGASDVFAVADHQVAHIYLNRPALLEKVRSFLLAQGGVESVLGKQEKIAEGIDHPRAGDLIAVAKENAWFTYYFWEEDKRAPDYARTVDIHRKPGYDPVELFLDPAKRGAKFRIAWKLLQKKLGFRMLMDFIPLDASLVKGSHGRRNVPPADQPLIIAPDGPASDVIRAEEVYGILRQTLVG